MSKKTAGVPLLLESFPEPPSFIPHSPLPSTPLLTINPPPSRPPATPLPPVPGPSRFSWQEAQRLLHGHEDSISDISMHDLPVDDDDDDDLNAITTKVSPTKPSTPHRKSSFTARPIVVSQSTSSIPTGRAASPEITDIISRTPRPRRSSSTTFSVRSTSTPRPPPSSSRRRASSPINHTYNSSSTFTASAAWEEGDFIDDYTSLERQLEGEGSDSDSSLDLHTPLPHLMVKHGLLSPRSKLIGKSTSLDSLSSEEGSDPRASTISLAASTKSSILKDTRDTPRRRVRHRDGKLLRGGLGLTTGLGWSDSEDEDAPSPLTKRISSLNLRRAASEAGDEDNTRRMTRSSSASLGSTWRSTMSSGYTAPPSRLSSSSSISSYHPPRSRASSSSTSSSYNHPPVASRGFERALQSGLMEEGDVLKPTKVPKIRTSSVDKDKLLPSLPNPRTGSIRRPTPSQIRADQEVRRTTSTGTLERKRSMLPAGPRTLRLPSCPVISTSLSSPGSERAVPVPRIPLNKPPLSPMSPRPRTGTGMVYKSHGVTL